MFTRCKKNCCYFCDICGHLEERLCLFTFQVFSFAKFVILAILAILASVYFHVASKILVTFAIFATLTCSADFSRAFFAFLPFKCFLFINLLFFVLAIFASQLLPKFLVNHLLLKLR